MSTVINELDYAPSYSLSENPGHEIAYWVVEARRGNPEAFDQLVERFESTVFTIAMRRLRNRADAQELCQEVFLRVFDKLDQLDDPRCFAGWIRSITVRMAINRAVRRRPILTDETALFESDSPQGDTPLSAILAKERVNQVHDGLGRLRDLDRQTLEAFYFNGQSINEMSDEFEAPVGTIKRRLHTARRRLAKELGAMAVN